MLADIGMMGFFPVLEGCEIQMASAYIKFCKSGELDLARAIHERGCEDQYFPYDFRLAAVRNLPEYYRPKRRRLDEKRVWGNYRRLPWSYTVLFPAGIRPDVVRMLFEVV